MFYERTIAPAIQKINATFPVLVVTGPRQIGKTTLLTRLAEKDRKIVSLDNPTIRSFAKTDPELFLQRYAPPVLIDEVQYAPELFLAAVDKGTGKIAGTLNGLATNETKFRDAFFDEISLYDPKGENVMLLGLSVLPEYRGQGIARALMEEYSRREQKNGRKQLILTCLQDKVEMYKKMNFRDEGISASTWGGEEWHDMTRKLND